MHSLRKQKRVNYALLNDGKRSDSGSEERSDEEVDLNGKKDLVEEDLDYLDVEAEEDDFMEEGEISESESENEMEKLIKTYSKSGNVEKLRELIKAKKAKCRTLQKEISQERQKEKDKEVRELLAELNKVSKTEQTLERTLAGSKNNTPNSSPKRKHTVRSVVKSTSKNKVRSSKLQASPRGRSRHQRSTEDEREYKNILDSILNIKQGKAEAYSELVDKAMNATDNILQLKHTRNDDNQHTTCTKHKNDKHGNTTMHTEAEATDGHDKSEVLQLLNAIQTKVKGGQHLNADLFKDLVPNAKNNNTTCILDSNDNSDFSDNTSERNDDLNKQADCNNTRTVKGKKLISGRCTKPDEVDIKRVVKYPHKKLDARHVPAISKVFDKLDSNLLIAGELEIASQPDLSTNERIARINIAKTMCYHRKYLDDAQIRDGYDQLLKKVEQGIQNWDNDLGEMLHEYFDYQANKMVREKVNIDNAQKAKSSTIQTRNDKTDKSKNEETIIFCGLYNKGTCNYDDHHDGRFSNRPVVKWHICSKCLKKGERRSHREIDSACPNKL